MADTSSNSSSSSNSSDKSRSTAPSNPITVNASSVTKGLVQEDGTLTAAGTISITDTNQGATQTWSIKGDAKGTYGTFALDNAGKWTYALNNSASVVQSLAAGQSRTDSFTVQVKDSKGATATQVVTMTVQGTNDAPVITHSSVSSEGQGDDGSGRVSGSVNYTDADKGDSHAASVALKPLVASAGVPASVSTSLSQAIKTNINDEGESGKGVLKWDFTLPSTFPKLAVGQSVLATYQLSISDKAGATSGTQDVNVLIVGTGGTPKVYAVAAQSSLTELTNTTGSTSLDTASGVLAGSDLSMDDHSSLSSALVMSSWSTGTAIPAAAASALANAVSLTAVPTVDTDDDSDGDDHDDEDGDTSLAWSFKTPDKTFDFLAAGEKLTLAYRVTSSEDGHTRSEIITITVIGTNDGPVLAADASGPHAITEIALTSGSSAADTTSGKLNFADVDLSDTHSVVAGAPSFNWSGGALSGAQQSALSAASTFGVTKVDSTGTGSGSVSFNYSAADEAFDFLAAGQTLTITYGITVTDNNGVSSTQPVTITVTGTNDAPVVTAAQLAGGVTEQITPNGNLTSGGAIAFGDVDLTDSHVASAAAIGTTLGTLTASVSTDTTNSGTGGQVTWNYAVADSAVEYLAAGQSKVESFTVKLDDQHGSVVTKQVDVTITGTNDAPVITSAAQTGSVTEDSAPAPTATGAVTFTDVDLTDTHGAVVVAANTNTTSLGTMSLAALSDSTNGAAGTQGWTYTLDNAAANYLPAGAQVTENYTITVTDNNGATATQSVAITITGTNDAATVSSDTKEVTEGNAASDLNSSGQLAITDPDTGEDHVVAQNNVAGTYGTFSVNANGAWTYVGNGAHDELTAGQQVSDAFTVKSQDGTGTGTVTVNITGTNDAATVSSDTKGVTEGNAASDLNASGQLTIADPDAGEAHVVPQNNVAGTYGTFSLDANGAWTYVGNGAHDELAAGQPASDSFTVSSQDGTATGTVKVNITGSNDAPVVAAQDTSGAVTALPSGTSSPIVFTVQQYLGYQSNDLSALRAYSNAHAADYTVQTTVIDYTDDPAGFAGELPGSNRWPAAEAQNYNGTGGFGQNNVNSHFFARITGEFSVSTADTYTFRTFNDDGVFLLVDNQLIISDTGYHPEAPFTGSIALTPGNHKIELFFYENEGEASLEFSVKNSTGTYGLVGANGGGLIGTGQVTDSGAIAFSDVDLTDSHVVSVAPVGTTVGTMTAVKASDTTGTGTGGQVNWNYNALNSKLETLAQNETKHDLFNITVDDQHGGVITRQVDVTLTGVNDKPVINSPAQSGAVSEAINNSADEINNVTHQASGSISFSDVDLSDAHTVTVTGNGAQGYRGTLSASLSNPSTGDGSGAIAWTYSVADGALDDLAQGQVLTQTYSVTVDDGHGGTASQNVVVTITGAGDNTPPVAVNDSVTTNEDVPFTFSVVGNDTDVDAQSLSAVNVSALSNTALGALQNLGGGQFSFNPAPNAFGTTSFTYQANDGEANSGNTATVNITVNPVNDAPVAVSDAAAVQVAALNTQAQSNLVHWVNWTSNSITGTETVVAPIGGTAVGSIGKVLGTIDLGNGQSVNVTYSGEYQFVQTNGGTDFYNSTTGSIGQSITPIGTYTSAAVANPPPNSDIVALNGAYQTRTLTFTDSAGNIVPVDNLFFAIVSMNGNGYKFDQDFQIVSSGPGYWGTGTFTRIDNLNGTWTVSGSGEPHGVLSINGSVGKLTWTSMANENWNGFTVGTYGKAQTGTATGNLLANDTDVEHDALTVTAVNGTAITGNSVSLTLTSGAKLNVNKDGTYLYDENGKFGSLAQGAPGQDGFTYTISDGHGGVSTANVTINLTGVNDAPVATNVSVGSYDWNAPITVPKATLLANASDVDQGDTATLSLAAVGGAQHGTVVLNANGDVVFTPSTNYYGPASFTYSVKDTTGAVSNVATASITVAHQDIAPTISYAPVNAVVNGSFEQPGSGVFTSAVPGGSTAITGWTVTGDTVDYMGWPSADGTWSLDMNGNNPGGVQQILNTVPNETYTVGFALSKNAADALGASIKVSAAGTSTDYNAPSTWTPQTFTFTANAYKTTLAFTSTSPTSASPYHASGPALDAVSMVPSTIAAPQNVATTIKGLSVDDADAGTNSMQVTLSVGHGSVALASTTNLSSTGSGGTISYTGLKADLNAALASGVVFTPTGTYTGADTLTATISDLGNTGIGGPLSATKTVAINVNPGPISEWKANGNASDAVAPTNNGTAVNVGYTAGPNNDQAFSFNGTNAYVTVNPELQNDFTITGWLKTTQAVTEGTNFYRGAGVVYADVSGITGDYGVSLLNNGVNTVLAFGTGGNQDVTLVGNTRVNDGAWHFFAAVRSGSTISLYVDNVSQGSVNTNYSLALSAPPAVYFGWNQTGSQPGVNVTQPYFTGALDDISFYNEALTPVQLTGVYSSAVA